MANLAVKEPTRQVFYQAKDVMALIKKGETTSRCLIRKLNKELEEKGYITFRGRVPAKYFHERVGL